MSNETTTQTSAQQKKRRGTGLMILLIVFVILFLLTTAILGSQLYNLATRDQYTVDLGLGSPEGSIELFRIAYENESGEITVQGVNAESVVAPGTSVSYDVRLRNHDDVIIDYLLTPKVEFLSDLPVPIQFKLIDAHGNYLLGSEETWASAEELNALSHKGSIHPTEVATYHIAWQWAFEEDDRQDAQDTQLGLQNGATPHGLALTITTDAVANPTPVKSNAHLMHLFGEGLGCCWCCWLLWVLLAVAVALLVWIWLLRRKLNKLEQPAEA